MYERSAIVLERYVQKIFEFDKANNLKTNYKNFAELLEEVEKYQELAEKEGKIIKQFDDTVKEIEDIQAKQGKICEQNQKLEQNRNQLFMDLGEDSKILDNKFKKTEKIIEENNKYLKELREDFINYLSDFSNRQKERNKCEKARRIGEANHVEYLKKIKNEFQSIDTKDVALLKEFIHSEKDSIKQELNEIMTKNGKNEKIGFNQDVLKMAIKARISIAEKEAECYVLIYDKMKKFLVELENENFKISKYKKSLKDVSVKLEFLEAEKEYIFGFLDYERMTTIAGVKAHKKKMEEACQNFELDMIQIHNLYELILREISNKSTKKAYKELYNKTYLKNIEDKEKNFEEEVNNIRLNMGTVINSNYWRIEGIKNVYNVFQEEVTQKFDKDLSEFKLEESELEQDNNVNIEDKLNDDKNKKIVDNVNDARDSVDDENSDYYDEEYEDEEELEDEDYDEEYEDDYDEDEDYDEEYEDDYDEDEDYDEEYEDDYEEDEDYDEEYEDDYEEDEDYDEEYEDDYDEFDDEEDDDYEVDEREEKEYNKKVTNKKNNHKKQNSKEKEVKEIDDDAWEKEIIQQLNKKRTSKNASKKQNTNIFGKLFKDKKDNNKKKNSKKL